VSGFRGLAGVARRDITPPIGIRNRNWGPSTFDTADGVHRPLTLTALALQAQDGEPVLLMAVDATWWRRVADHAALRDAVLDALGLGEAQLLLSLSHTHAGAVLCADDRDLDGGELIGGYLETLRDAAIDAGHAALAALAPATVEWGIGHCDVAANRDLDLDGRALVGFNPARPADGTLLTGRACAADGAVVATIVNYACHPTTLGWANRKLSPDYVGALRDTVETATGAPCLFLQGASGELAPREQYSGDTGLADRHGAAIGHAAVATLLTMAPPATALQLTGVVESGAALAVWEAGPVELSQTLRATVTEVDLPLRPLPTLAELESELESQWDGIDPRSRDERLRRARQLRDDYLDLDNRPASVGHRVWTVRIGDAIVVAHPGEAYSAFQTELRRRWPRQAVVVANLTNGPGFVYLPNAQAYQRNAYQAWQTPLAEGALEALIDAASHAIAELTEQGPRNEEPCNNT
jgi:hypothetical protein